MTYILICFVAFAASGLTLFSGFGLGTILLPAFALFFPIELSVALTGIVHFLNNIFKLFLVGRHADKNVVLKFGLPGMLAALAGAFILNLLSSGTALYSYSLAGRIHDVLLIKLIIGFLLILFALFDVIPYFAKLQFNQKYLFIGGLLSGFFGGLSGNQGALRSAFLIRSNLSKEAYIATGVVIACLIDVTRLGVYSTQIKDSVDRIDFTLVSLATLCAFIGAFIGSRLMKKVTIKSVQIVVAVLLIVFGFLMCLGII